MLTNLLVEFKGKLEIKYLSSYYGSIVKFVDRAIVRENIWKMLFISSPVREYRKSYCCHPGVSISVQGPVVQSIVSLTSSLRDQLVRCITTL